MCFAAYILPWPWFLSLSTVELLGQIVVSCEGFSVHCWIFSSILGLYAVDKVETAVMTIKNVCRHFVCPLGAKSTPSSLKNIGLDSLVYTLIQYLVNKITVMWLSHCYRLPDPVLIQKPRSCMNVKQSVILISCIGGMLPRNSFLILIFTLKHQSKWKNERKEIKKKNKSGYFFSFPR